MDQITNKKNIKKKFSIQYYFFKFKLSILTLKFNFRCRSSNLVEFSWRNHQHWKIEDDYIVSLMNGKVVDITQNKVNMVLMLTKENMKWQKWENRK